MINYAKKYNLDNNLAFVLGGVGLIGKETSLALSSLGCRVIVLDNDLIKGKHFEKYCIKNNLNVKFIYFDCTKLSQLEKKFKSLVNNQGTPDIFINCSYPRTNDWKKNNFNEINVQSMQKNIDFHLNSYVWLARLSAESMKTNKSGTIIQLGSIYGLVGQNSALYKNLKVKENMTYPIIKGGIVSFTRQIASYYGKYNIRVNTVCPGAVESDDLKDLTKNKTFISRYKKVTPLKRLARTDEIASVIIFLSSEASSYITGSTIIVDGGMTTI